MTAVVVKYLTLCRGKGRRESSFKKSEKGRLKTKESGGTDVVCLPPVRNVNRSPPTRTFPNRCNRYEIGTSKVKSRLISL